jgi:Arc/MetJ-type ribon-helix-helix transcriptional regulator
MRPAANERLIGVRVPKVIYDYLDSAAKRKYKSISEWIREAIVEKIESEFTIKEWSMIEQALKESYKEKGVNWRNL